MIVGKLQLVDNIKREIPDNATGQVSPRDVRQNLINVIDSVHLFTDDNYLDSLNFSTPDTRTTRAGKEAIGKLHLQGYSSVDNSAFGYSALSDNYGGVRNTAIGSHSMGCNLYGDSNSALGFNSLAGNVFGSGNVALGSFTLQRNKFGNFNIAIGHGAGYYVGEYDSYKFYVGSHSIDEQYACDNPTGSGLVPLMYGDMKSLQLGVATIGLHGYGALQVSGDISPSQDCQHNLGHGSYRWHDLYLCNSINESVYFSGGYVGFGTSTPSGDQGLVTMAGHFVPSDDGIYALGHPDLRWDGYFSDITVSGTANIENAVYTNIEECTYHCRTLYLASSGLCEDLWGESPCPYLHDEQIEGGGFVLQSSGVDYRRNYEFIFSAPDTTLNCLEEDTPYSRSAWNSNISIHIASGSHIKTDRAIGRDNLSLLNDNCCYGIFMKKDTDGIREDRTGINEIQLIEIDATGGTFTLTFDGQTTEIPIPYNASAARVKAGLESLSNIDEGDVDVFKGSNSWEIRFTGTLGGQNVSQVTCNSAGLTKGGTDEECTTTDYPGVDEIQKIVITASAGEWKLGHSTRQVSGGDCSSDTAYNSQLGGYFTDPIPYDISASDLQTKMRDCFTGMSGNVSVSLSTVGNRRTYTITFVSGLEETNVNPWLVDRYSLHLGDDECTDEVQNEIINIELQDETGGTFNILTYLSDDDYNTDCPYYRSADIPFNATASELSDILTTICEAESWDQRGEDIDSGTGMGDWSGGSVSLSGTGLVVAIGAINSNTALSGGEGLVRVYEWNGSTWVLRGDIVGEELGDKSGDSVSLNYAGNYLAIGARNNDGADGATNRAGHVRVYHWDGSAYVQVGQDIDGEAAGDNSGWSVSLNDDGNLVAIGSPDNDDNGNGSGHVRVWEYASSTWVQLGEDIQGSEMHASAGASVSLTSSAESIQGNYGTVVAFGAPGAGGPIGQTPRGVVRVYYWNAVGSVGEWVKLGEDIIGEIGDRIGDSVSFNRDGATGSNTRVLAVGAGRNDDFAENAGIVRVYEYNNQEYPHGWVRRGDDILGKAAQEKSGYSVSLNAAGTILAIGSPETAYGGGPGRVRLYNWNDSSWDQSGTDIVGEAVGDFSGYSVSLSSYGSSVAIGAPMNDHGGAAAMVDAGHVRVYYAASSSTSCASYNFNWANCPGGIPQWIAGVNHYVTVIPSAGPWTPERLDIDGGTFSRRIQVGGQPGDWTIEFGNTSDSNSFFNGKNIAPMRLDISNLIGGVSLTKPAFTVVRTHEPIENAYNKITVSLPAASQTWRDNLRYWAADGYRMWFMDSMGAEHLTFPLDGDATIAQVIKAMNNAIGGVNADFFIPYISPGLVVGDPVYGDHEGKNKFWDVAGSYQKDVPRWGNDKLCAYNSRLDTNSTFLGTLIGEADPTSDSTWAGWAWDGMLGRVDLHTYLGVTTSFDILTHAGWYHNDYVGTNAMQGIHIVEMKFFHRELAHGGYDELNERVRILPFPAKQTTRPRRCVSTVGYDEGYDTEWECEPDGSYPLTQGQLSHLAGPRASLGDGIVGIQGNWNEDLHIRNASDVAGVSSQASGPSYNCDTTGKVINTSWSWFKSKLNSGNIII